MTGAFIVTINLNWKLVLAYKVCNDQARKQTCIAFDLRISRQFSYTYSVMFGSVRPFP